jgi:acetyl-CoA C-acetyltransferase
MAGSLVIAGARTPMGKLSGGLRQFESPQLGGFAVSAALRRAEVLPEEVDYVVMGHVIQAGAGQNTARQSAILAGIPSSVPATTINKVCLSGLHALYLADLMIASGTADIVVAGGMESMTRTPYLLPEARAGLRLGDATIVDAMMRDGLTDPFDGASMGILAERFNR